MTLIFAVECIQFHLCQLLQEECNVINISWISIQPWIPVHAYCMSCKLSKQIQYCCWFMHVTGFLLHYMKCLKAFCPQRPGTEQPEEWQQWFRRGLSQHCALRGHVLFLMTNDDSSLLLCSGPFSLSRLFPSSPNSIQKCKIHLFYLQWAVAPRDN